MSEDSVHPFYSEVPQGLSHAVAIGGALITMVEPHVGHEYEYNRWYEDDHFYSGAMAMPWMQAARYSDTNGYQSDGPRTMWRWRDWVIDAYNRNLPFDQFTIEQLAGDLLPNPTPAQLVATGFNRCNVTTSEGGSIAAEFDYRYAVDRTSTMLQTWMGLTGGCAVCHDHKYDPLTTKEFYSLYSFFYSAADPAMDGNVNITPPFYRPMTPEQQAALEQAMAAEQQQQAQLEQAAARAIYADPAESPSGMEKQPVNDLWLDDVFPWGAKTSCSSRNPASSRSVQRTKSSSRFSPAVVATATVSERVPNASW